MTEGRAWQNTLFVAVGAVAALGGIIGGLAAHLADVLMHRHRR